MMYNEAQQMLQDSDNTDNSEPTKITEMNPSNADVLQAIKEMDKRVANTIDGVIWAIKEIKERVKEAEECISGAKDSIESQVKKLMDKVDDMENKNRLNNLRLVGLPEREEWGDECAFLEAWIPKILEMDSSTTIYRTCT